MTIHLQIQDYAFHRMTLSYH